MGPHGKLTKLQRLIVLERSHETPPADITPEQANLRAWWQSLAEAEREKRLTLVKAAERQTRRRA